MAFQAAHYQREEGIDLEEFFDSAARVVETPELQNLLAATRKR